MVLGDNLGAEFLARHFVAKYNVKPVRTLNLDVMVNQRFWAIVKSINSCTDILIETSRSEILRCSVYGHEMEDEVCIENLQPYLNTEVIVQVHRVHNSILAVAFYNEWGSKIQLIKGYYHFENISILLECPVLTRDVHGYVSERLHDVIYVQPNEYLDDLSTLEERLTDTYDAMLEEEEMNDQFDEPQLYRYYALRDQVSCYAMKHRRKLWRRVRVVTGLPNRDGKICVELIDSGVCRLANRQFLRPLTREFLKIPKFCFRVNITNFFHREFMVPKGRDVIVLDIICRKGLLAASSLFYVGDVLPRNGVSLYRPCGEGEVLPVPVDDSHVHITICCVTSPNEFYVQKRQNHQTARDIRFTLYKELEHMQVLEDVKVGMQCAAPYYEDNYWYRAEAVDVNEDITTVRFIDYGNIQVMRKDGEKLRALPPKCLEPAALAIRCSLLATPISEKWSREAMDMLSDLLGKPITARFIKQDEKTHYAEIYGHNRSIREVLVASKLAKNCDALLAGQNGFVAHINSPSDFFIHLECHTSELEHFTNQLSDGANQAEITDPSSGTLCAAMYMDQLWYKERILSNTAAGIDYGTLSLNTNVRQLPEGLAQAPPLMLKCSLLRPEGLICWSPQATEKFARIASNGNTMFVVENISTGDTSYVRLLLDGQDVVQMLKPQTVPGQVFNIRSIECFDLSCGTNLVTDVKLETVSDTTWVEKSTDDFKDALRLRTTLVDIEFVDESTVRIYIEGHDIRRKIINSDQVEMKSDDGWIEEECTVQHVQTTEETVSNSGNDSDVWNSEPVASNSEVDANYESLSDDD